MEQALIGVVPYIGTWIETHTKVFTCFRAIVVPYIGTWIETKPVLSTLNIKGGRTLYRYVD